MKTIIYSPQTNASPDEIMQVLKVFTIATLPEHMKTESMLFGVYNSLPDNAKRHFRIMEEND